MKKFSDLLDIDQHLVLVMDLSPVMDVDPPQIHLVIGQDQQSLTLTDAVTIKREMPLLEPVKIEIHLHHKVYSIEHETAVLIRSFSIDGYDLMPYLDRAVYQNDHGWTGTTNYLGFNGCWRWQLDDVFYRWWHEASGQGWLLLP